MANPFNQNPSIGQFEIVKIGTSVWPSVTVSNPGAGQYTQGESITTVAHNLGFTPAFLIFMNVGNLNYPAPKIFLSASGSTAEWDLFQASTDQNNIYLYTDVYAFGKGATTGGSGFNCKYYLLRERTVH